MTPRYAPCVPAGSDATLIGAAASTTLTTFIYDTAFALLRKPTVTCRQGAWWSTTGASPPPSCRTAPALRPDDGPYDPPMGRPPAPTFRACAGLFLALLAAGGCAERSYTIDADLIDGIRTPRDGVRYRSEIVYLALKGDRDTVERLFRLIPLIIKDDAERGAMTSTGVAAIIIARACAADPGLAVLGTLEPRDRALVFRYLCALGLADLYGMDLDAIMERYGIPLRSQDHGDDGDYQEAMEDDDDEGVLT